MLYWETWADFEKTYYSIFDYKYYIFKNLDKIEKYKENSLIILSSRESLFEYLCISF